MVTFCLAEKFVGAGDVAADRDVQVDDVVEGAAADGLRVMMPQKSHPALGAGWRDGLYLRLLVESAEVVLDAGDHPGAAGNFSVPPAFGVVVWVGDVGELGLERGDELR